MRHTSIQIFSVEGRRAPRGSRESGTSFTTAKPGTNSQALSAAFPTRPPRRPIYKNHSFIITFLTDISPKDSDRDSVIVCFLDTLSFPENLTVADYFVHGNPPMGRVPVNPSLFKDSRTPSHYKSIWVSAISKLCSVCGPGLWAICKGRIYDKARGLYLILPRLLGTLCLNSQIFTVINYQSRLAYWRTTVLVSPLSLWDSHSLDLRDPVL